MKFEEFKLNEKLLEAIDYMGFKEASPIQEKSIPIILDGKDIIACAQTGTGKTAAFILPVLHKLAEKKEKKGVNALVICPTRELAIQIEQQIQGFAYFVDASSIAIYGGGDGTNWEAQKTAVTGDCDIIVATPGKLISHLNMGYANFEDLEHLILDEADRMLDMGFMEDIQKIISYLPKKKQSLFFSATMPSKIRTFAKKNLVNPEEVSISIAKPAEGVLQAVYLTYDNQKTAVIKSLIDDKPEYQSIIIFTSSKRKVNEIVSAIRGEDYTVKGISSDLEQADREQVLLDFRAKNIRVLVGTDVISRGIDIKDINLVINFDVPNDAQDYVHRVGRTARANTTGVAITLVNEADMYKFQQIETLIEREIPKLPLPNNIGESPKWNPSFKKKGGYKRNFHSKKKRNN